MKMLRLSQTIQSIHVAGEFRSGPGILSGTPALETAAVQ